MTADRPAVYVAHVPETSVYFLYTDDFAAAYRANKFPADAQAAGAREAQVDPPLPAPLADSSTDTGLQPESAVSTADSVQKESTP